MKSKIRILLLEDEERIGELYVRTLKNAGFKVEWAQSTLMAESLARMARFHVILLDHGIKGEGRSGMDLVPTLKEFQPESKIFILSNYNLSQIEGKMRDNVHYLLKIDTPPSVLIKKIHQSLSE